MQGLGDKWLKRLCGAILGFTIPYILYHDIYLCLVLSIVMGHMWIPGHGSYHNMESDGATDNEKFRYLTKAITLWMVPEGSLSYKIVGMAARYATYTTFATAAMCYFDVYAYWYAPVGALAAVFYLFFHYIKTPALEIKGHKVFDGGNSFAEFAMGGTFYTALYCVLRLGGSV